jgi:hypothetical protein
VSLSLYGKSKTYLTKKGWSIHHVPGATFTHMSHPDIYVYLRSQSWGLYLRNNMLPFRRGTTFSELVVSVVGLEESIG